MELEVIEGLVSGNVVELEGVDSLIGGKGVELEGVEKFADRVRRGVTAGVFEVGRFDELLEDGFLLPDMINDYAC